jgi:uncharacterized iron-regulated membrane protein
MIRPILVLLHRYVGLATAVFLLIVGLTGSLLAYLQPISAWLSPELYEAPARGVVLSPVELTERASAAEPRGVIGSYPLKLEVGRGVSLRMAAKDPTKPLGYDTLWLDPVSGAVLGRVDNEAFPPTRQSLMRFVYKLHYALALPGRWGEWIVGIVAILWFIDCFVGAILTFPRGRPFLQKWRPAFGIKRRRLNYDLHRAGGLWPWLLLATLALSGVYFNLGAQVFMPLFGMVAETTKEPYDTRPRLPVRAPQIAPGIAIEIAAAKAKELGWTAVPEGLYRSAAQGFWQVYYDKPAAQWATAGGYALFIDDQTGAVIFVRAPGGTHGDMFLAWLSALHLGTVFGWPYRIVLCLLGLAIASLSVTGVVVWWRKRRARQVAARKHQAIATTSQEQGSGASGRPAERAFSPWPQSDS